MSAAPLIPARRALTPDGAPFCEQFGDVYHSADGGPGQARHVFLAGNGLPSRWRGREVFVILETGFGLGLNFLATWSAWREDPQRCGRLHFVSVEKHPFRAADLATLHCRYPEFAALAAELRQSWPPLTPGFHRLHLDGGRVCLTLLFGDVLDCLRRATARVDAFYLDGFAPEKNPAMWAHPVFLAMARLAQPQATLATWTVAAAVREALATTGFATEKRPGFGRKREMLTGRYAPAAHRHAAAAPSPPASRQAVIIGAGPAGSAACERLACHGWEVEIVERRPAAMPQDISAHLAGIVHPMLSRDDNIASRLSRAGFLYTLRQWHALRAQEHPFNWSPCGVLQIALNPGHEQLLRKSVEALQFPGEYAWFAEVEEAARLVGRRVGAGGVLFPAGGWVNPPSLCAAELSCHSNRVRRHLGREAISLERRGGDWHVLDAKGATIAQAPVVVLANAFDARAFSQARGLFFRRIRGQVSFLPALALAPIPLVVCGNGYLTPAVGGVSTLGATYDFNDDDPNPSLSGHESNLVRLEKLLPGAAAGIDAAALKGRVGFRTASPDRLPLAGALPNEEEAKRLAPEQLHDVQRWPGLYSLLGYGSRGLVWAALAAELLASRLDGEPLPLEADLVAAVDPARFLLRAIRRGLC